MNIYYTRYSNFCDDYYKKQFDFEMYFQYILPWLSKGSFYYFEDPPDTDDLKAINCHDERFGVTSCGGISVPFVSINNAGSSYPDGGFCVINNTLYDDIMDPEELDSDHSYSFTAAVCAGLGYFEGGIFFNFQDENNYDTFYTTRYFVLEYPLLHSHY